MTKSIAYTAAIVASMTSQYQAGVDIKIIATDLGKTVPQVRGKLVAEGVYIPKVKTSSAGVSKAVRKISLVQAISDTLGVAEVTSFEKASKADLETILEAVQALVEGE